MNSGVQITNTAVIDLAEFILESDAIEEIDNDPDSLIKRVRSGVEKMRISEQKNSWGSGHVGAILMLESLARNPINQAVTKELICDVQSLITTEQNKRFGGHRLAEEFIGEYRRVNISVGGRECPSFELVDSLMEELLNGQSFVWWQQNARTQGPEQNVKAIADFHYKFLMIHPFADGNGRTARVLSYFLLRANPPYRHFNFCNFDKHEDYYPCFDDANGSSAMRSYFLSRMGVDSGGLI